MLEKSPTNWGAVLRTNTVQHTECVQVNMSLDVTGNILDQQALSLDFCPTVQKARTASAATDWQQSCLNLFKYYIYIYMSPVPGPPHPPPSPPNGIPPPLLTSPTPQNLVFACYLHIYIHIYTYILPFPPLQPGISTLFAALESHDLVNGPCLPVYSYHNLFFEPPIVCLAHGLQHICYLWITQSLPVQT